MRWDEFGPQFGGTCILRRKADEHTASTMSLMVAPWALPSALISGMGRVTAANARPWVTDTFMGVFGARVRLCTLRPAPPNRPESYCIAMGSC